jgi:sulfatase maturation enzyme AslB (radical SAM superfamily)
MTQSVANQAINLFKQICIDGSTIGFYGGEPLLNFDLIKYVVNRIKNEISNKKINFA